MAEIASKEPIVTIETPAARAVQTVLGRLATNPLPADMQVSDARLPEIYERAKTALVQCSRIDECQEWANKAEALASYARQADDDSLRKLADRIQARAVRRCGELLKQFDGRGGDRSKNGGAPIFAPSRREAATQAGISKDQQVTAVRVASVPADQFEQAVESDTPPTVTALAKAGTQARMTSAVVAATPQPPPPPHAAPVTAPAGFKQATHLIGVVRDFAAFCEKNDPAVVADGLMRSEISEVRNFVGVIDGWLDRLVVNLAPGVPS
jgi:AbiEi antitoxin C-terminal domain